MASPPRITCPNCNKSFKGKTELIGKKIRCPSCKEPFVALAPQEDKAQQEEDIVQALLSNIPEKEKTKAVDFGDEEDENPYGAVDVDLSARCPNCANPMENEDAIVCLYCGYNTMTRTWGQTKKVYDTTAGQHILWLLPGIICLVLVIILAVGALYYCLELPEVLTDSWWSWLTHESLRMWVVIITLGLTWAAGIFVYLRLVLHPTPPEVTKH